GEAFNCRDLGARRLRRHHGARLDGAAVEVHHAGPALTGVASHVGPGRAQRLAQELNQESPVLHVPRHGAPVDLNVDLSHSPPPCFEYEYIGGLRLGKEGGRTQAIMPTILMAKEWRGTGFTSHNGRTGKIATRNR